MSTIAPPEIVDGMVPVAVKSLGSSGGFDFRLYMQSEEARHPRLYKDRQIPMSPKDIQNLIDRGTRVLFIRSDDAAAYRDHVNSNVLTNDALPLNERFEVLRDSTRSLLSDAFDRHDSTDLASTTGSVSGQLTEIICSTTSVLCDLFSVMQHDYSAFAHAMNVCTYSVLLARQLGVKEEQDLAQLAQGALLHDIGKHGSQAAKSGQRGGAESGGNESAESHAVVGFSKFASGQELTNSQLLIIYQHHERCDGQGGPVGLVASEIHPWSRIVAIANTLANYMQAQPGASGQPPNQEALQFLEIQAGKLLDKDMTSCWISALRSRHCQV